MRNNFAATGAVFGLEEREREGKTMLIIAPKGGEKQLAEYLPTHLHLLHRFKRKIRASHATERKQYSRTPICCTVCTT